MPELPADLLLVAGVIGTLDPGSGRTGALAVRDGKVLAPCGAAEHTRGPDTAVVDLRRRVAP